MNESWFTLGGQTVIQFGGTGLLGRTLTLALKSCGADVIIATRNRERFDRGSAHLRVEEVDITVERSVMELRDRVYKGGNVVNGLVFNTVSRPMRSMGDPLDQWQSSMATNATGLFCVLRAFGDAMAESAGGSIVAIGSIQGAVGVNPHLYTGTDMGAAPDYFFHKAGMINLVRYLASHYGSRGVRVNTVSPGGIYNAEQPPPEGFLERYSQMTMLGRMADPAEIAGAVIFLLTSAASYITGANLLVDGGYTAK